MHRIITSFIILTLSIHLFGQADKKDSKDKWDVANPPGEWNWKDLNFSTDEGTWMSLDVSPDGSSIVFDMLGDIYTLPITGAASMVLFIEISSTSLLTIIS